MSQTAVRATSFGLAVLLTAGCAATASEARPAPPTRTATQRSQGVVDHARICLAQVTRLRVADQRCDDREQGHVWFYVPVTSAVPAVGTAAAEGLPYAPPRRPYRASAKGGSGQGVLVADDGDRVKICVRVTTRVRVPDERCDDRLDGHDWYHLPMERRVPAIGGKAERGTFVPPGSVATFRARPGGGKGSKAAIRPATSPPGTAEPRPTRSTTTPRPTSRPTTRPTTRPTAKPTVQPAPTRSRKCRTVRSGGSSTTRCS
ncbi:hypothetical protein [Nonomuraea gerenzanensis]|uniref:Lipoprotein n=1 Tax=Nonomuraea gerenzanensis TaxID=93944 RepID=A0A1M4E358_9ACTN|nr:hypothetical protein [Nonomuraea gerenzanensis]UBU15468.1 hypothetical protein LCN96_10720 [Nonomuraea gerenzanensis]SBO93226.1 hypothetical protein BN4615_P2740 [Nonomuraea gerenzanensis]